MGFTLPAVHTQEERGCRRERREGELSVRALGCMREMFSAQSHAEEVLIGSTEGQH